MCVFGCSLPPLVASPPSSPAHHHTHTALSSSLRSLTYLTLLPPDLPSLLSAPFFPFKIEEVQSTTKTQRVAVHTHIKVGDSRSRSSVREGGRRREGGSADGETT